MRLLAPAAVLLLSACANLAPSVKRLDDVPPGKVAVVGKVRLVPALEKDDQDITGIGAGRVRNKLYLVLGEKAEKLRERGSMGTRRIEADLGNSFFVELDRRDFHVNGGELFVEATGRGQKLAYFPGGLKVDVRPDDRAVYIGTIVYYRDEFFNVTKVSVQDEFEQARGQFEKKFRSKRLRKSLAGR